MAFAAGIVDIARGPAAFELTGGGNLKDGSLNQNMWRFGLIGMDRAPGNCRPNGVNLGSLKGGPPQCTLPTI